MKNNSYLKKSLSLFVSFFVVGTFFIVHGTIKAETLSELQQQQSSISDEIRQNQQEIDAAEDEIDTLSYEINDLNSSINYTESKISEIESQIEQNQKDIEDLQSQIEEKERQLGNEEERKSEAIRTIYESRKSTDPIRMFLTSSTLSQLLNNTTYLEALENKIQSTIEDISNLKTNLEKNKEDLENKQTESESLKEQEKAYKRGLEDQVYTKDLVLDNKEDEVYSLETKIAEAKELQSEVEAQISAVMASMNNNNGRTIIASDRGVSDVGFMWPANYQYISAYYGESTPFQSAHSGIDLANISGTPIYATASGTVTNVTSMQLDGHYYAYGNYIIIGHNARFSSLYAHLMSFSVSPGDEVTQGQIIGYMGSTGWSTGPHLHFEVWEYGNRMNPINYLP